MRISDWSSDVCSSDLPNGCNRRILEDGECVAAIQCVEVVVEALERQRTAQEITVRVGEREIARLVARRIPRPLALHRGGGAPRSNAARHAHITAATRPEARR